MAKLKHIIESADEFEALAEPVREFYSQRDGRYFLDTDGEVDGLKRSLTAARSERDQAIKRVKELEGAGAADKEQLQTRYSELRSQYEQTQGELADARRSAASASEALNRQMVAHAASAAVAEHGGIAKLLEPVLLARLATRTEDGLTRVVVLGEDGQAMTRPGGSAGEYMTPGEFAAGLKQDKEYQAAFHGTGVNGSGAVSAGAPRGGRRDMGSQISGQVGKGQVVRLSK